MKTWLKARRCATAVRICDTTVSTLPATVLGAAPGADLAVFRADGRPVAIDGACLRFCTSLATGTVDGSRVACPDCGWQYDLFTGAFTGVPALRLDVYQVNISAGWLYAHTRRRRGSAIRNAPAAMHTNP